MGFNIGARTYDLFTLKWSDVRWDDWKYGSIRENARQSAKDSGDSANIEQHPLADQIEADRHLASKQASRPEHICLLIIKAISPEAHSFCSS
ncbi:MAG: hypothetical protein C0478_16060 [Planctomyces sp.]|nr:hypothetical protein [Planctomyces sp.]